MLHVQITGPRKLLTCVLNTGSDTRPLLRLLAAALLIGATPGLSGCGASQPTSALAWEPVNAGSLRAARQRWAAARIEVYDYAPYCEVWSHGRAARMPQPHVNVRQGRAVSAARPTPPGFLEHTEPLTMDAIFGVLEQAADGRLTAVFDRDTGVPLQVCEPGDGDGGRWRYCAVGAFHVPQRHSGNPERLRWPQAPVAGSCPRSDIHSAAPRTDPGE